MFYVNKYHTIPKYQNAIWLSINVPKISKYALQPIYYINIKKGKKYNARAYPYMDKNQKDNKIRIK